MIRPLGNRPMAGFGAWGGFRINGGKGALAGIPAPGYAMTPVTSSVTHL